MIKSTMKPTIRTAFTLTAMALLVGCSNGAGTGLLSPRAPVAQTDVAQGDVVAFEEIDVSYEAAVAFGEIARVCEAKDKNLGALVATTGTGEFEIYDTAPAGIALRRFYLTGFDDGCPRQFMASTTAFGMPSVYEAQHYGKAGFVTGASDAAYEQIKTEVCRVPAGTPCGKRIKRLDKTTVFLSAYDLTGDTERWTDYLIHKGALVASAVKGTDTSISE
jgi:hypothetical protein